MSAPQKKFITILPWALLVIVVLVCILNRNQWFGKKQMPVAQPAAVVDLRALAQNTGLAEKGKDLFKLHCASCHGAKGYGDGEKAKGLNPPPRNYHTEPFKYGNDIASLYNTLLKGSPGTSMASFAQLSHEELMALAHYVRTQISNPSPTTAEVLAKLPATASAITVVIPETAARIPVKLAMQRIAQAAPLSVPASNMRRELAGAELYRSRCAKCHGNFAEGKAIHTLAVHPYRYQSANSLTDSKAVWMQDRNKFASAVLNGFPGRSMPGHADLSRAQVDELFVYFRALGMR